MPTPVFRNRVHKVFGEDAHPAYIKNILEISDTDEMTYSQGFTDAYQTKPQDGGRFIEMREINGLFNKCFGAIKELQETCERGNMTVEEALAAFTCTGNSATATKLTTSAGSNTQAVYFNDGKPVAATGTLNNNISGRAAMAGNADYAASAGTAASANYATNAGNAATVASCTGNSATATKLKNTRTISLTGAVTGSASTDLSGNVSIATILVSSGNSLSISESGSNAYGRYVKFSNGLIVQWGRKNITNGILDTYTFPYPFKGTQFYSVVISPYHSTGGGWASSVYNSGSQTFDASVWIAGGGVPESFSFFAIGF